VINQILPCYRLAVVSLLGGLAFQPASDRLVGSSLMPEPKAIIHQFDTSDLAPPVPEPSAGFDCDVCGGHFDGDPAGSGLFMWTRGDEVRFEEPPLCDGCAQNVTLDALTRWEVEEEEG
jgi:hypothetical protein